MGVFAVQCNFGGGGGLKENKSGVKESQYTSCLTVPFYLLITKAPGDWSSGTETGSYF
jgi:hypothetical protein